MNKKNSLLKFVHFFLGNVLFKINLIRFIAIIIKVINYNLLIIIFINYFINFMLIFI